MLSTEKPPPGPVETSPLKSSCKNFITSNERSSENSNMADLSQSGLGDINQTIPKFSVRDYVFSHRATDIESNWPFSLKNLQLCLKHSVKDVLPPFEDLESVRNPSPTKFIDQQANNPSAKFSESNYHLHSGPPNRATESNLPDKNCECPSATTNASSSDVNSTPIKIQSPLPKPKSQHFPVFEKPEDALRAIKARTSPIVQNPAKKCRLIEKLGNSTVSKEKSSEEFLEAIMGSKMCPVCKTFTSSSNTTLNAHIDQCLSGDSSEKWFAKSRIFKHRIKPRKIRLMVDIYETALSCTLEDLDRRNGTNWASNFSFPAQDLENRLANDDINDMNIIKNSNSSSIAEDKNKGDGVYFDSNGTKLRILSSFSDVKLNYTNEEVEDSRTRMLVKREKVHRIIPGKKRKHHVWRQHKLLKSPLFEQRRSSPRLKRCPDPLTTSINDTLEAVDHHLKSKDCGIKKHWASSKRTGLEMKKNPDLDSCHHPNKIANKSRIGRHDPSASVDEKLTKRANDLIFSISSDDNSVSDTDQTHKRKKSTPLKSVEEYMPCQINRAGFFSFGTQEKESGPSSFSGLEKVRGISSTFERQKLSPLNKNRSLWNHTNFSEPKKNLQKTRFDSKKPMLHEEPLSRSIIHKQPERNARNLSINRSFVFKNRKEKYGFLNSNEEGTFSDHSSKYSNDSTSSLTDTTPAASTPDATEAAEIPEEFYRESNLEIFGESEVEECEQEMLISDKDNREPVAIFNFNEVEGSYSIEVDPIPIPGPPGSFLPSPRSMGLEELQGNSSITTFRVHFSEHDGPEPDSPSSNQPFFSNSIPIVERPISFEREAVLDQLKIDCPRANSVIPESSDPSTANPVLRLMGKNLMVVNREENLPPRTGHSPSCNENGFQDLQPSGGIQNECPLFYDDLPRGPPFLEYSHFHSSFTTPQSFPNPSRDVTPRINPNEGLRSSFERLDQPWSTVGFEVGHPPIRPRFEKDPAFFPQSAITPTSCLGKHKDTIILNGLPEEAPSSAFKTMYHENLVFGCQTRCYPFPSGSWKTVESANITQTPSPFRKHGTSVNLDLCMPGIATALINRDPLTALLSPSTGHGRTSSSHLPRDFSLPANFA